MTADEGVVAAAHKVRDALSDVGVRVGLDDRTDTAYGRRAIDAELKGYPIRVAVGPRDIADGRLTVVRRVSGTKEPVAFDDVAPTVIAALEIDQQSLYDEALAYREAKTIDVSTVDEAIEASASGWARVPWDRVGLDGEAKANASGVTVRCLLRPDGGLPDADDEPGMIAVLGRAY